MQVLSFLQSLNVPGVKELKRTAERTRRTHRPGPSAQIEMGPKAERERERERSLATLSLTCVFMLQWQ